MAVKQRLDALLQGLLASIRDRRAAYARDPDYVFDVLRQGTTTARDLTEATLQEVRAGLGLFRLD